MLDTLPVAKNESGAASNTSATTENEHVVEMNAEGATATPNIIAWDSWWQLKEQTNMQLF